MKFQILLEDFYDTLNIPRPTKQDNVANALVTIWQEELKVSEKDFIRMDELMKLSKEVVETQSVLVEEGLSQEQRVSFIAEKLFDALKTNEEVQAKLKGCYS